MEKEQSVWDIGGRQDQGELFQALETLAYFTEPSLPTAFLHHTHPVARKRKEQYQQGKTETATASSAEVEPFLKFSRLHRPLTARPEGPPVLLFPPVRPLFSSCQPRRWETAEGRADNHGSTKQVNWKTLRCWFIPFEVLRSGSCRDIMRGLPKALPVASWSSLLKIQNFQRRKRSPASGHKMDAG